MAGLSTPLSIWHDGETYLQEKLGVAQRMAAVGQRVVRDFMPDEHRDFYQQLPFIVLGSVDAQGDAWATFLEGQPGFMRSPTPTRLDIAGDLAPNDPAASALVQGASIGLLGIELHTRRRNRMNGVLTAVDVGLSVSVDQSFGNCPRYIQLRDMRFDREPGAAVTGAAQEMNRLDAAARTLIETSDTFFVATYTDRAGTRQADVSHRGGRAGFVRVDADGLLTIPDFNGNLFFSTLGNMLMNGQAGLLFVDFESGDTLQMTGEAAVLLDSPEIPAFQGAERLWTFRPRRIVRRRGALALRWTSRAQGISDSALMTGDWQQAEARQQASKLADRWQALTVSKIVQESESIRSFHLAPEAGTALLPHLAGQYLPIRVLPPGSDTPVIRTYTLSVAPSDNFYRISVKRDGIVSTHLHDQLREGDRLEARAPAGQFTMDAASDQPAVLIAGGVGITPMLAMLRHIVYDGLRRQRIRPTTLFYAARSKKERAFAREIAALTAAAQGAVKVVHILGEAADAVPGIDFDAVGRIDLALLRRLTSLADKTFYLCGPPAFTQAIYDALTSAGVADHRIHAESFGPASLQRVGVSGPAAPARLPAATTSVPVTFTKSLKEARWAPASGTLLDLAEARGLSPAFSCRQGHCGTCRTRLLSGSVTYVKAPTADVRQDEVLICCAVPAAQQRGDETCIELAL